MGDDVATLVESSTYCAAVLVDTLVPLGRVLTEALGCGAAAERLTPAQYRTLLFLAKHDGLSSELARFLGVTRSSVTTTVDVLVGRGLVERVPSRSDRRCAPLRSTAAGQACLSTARARLLERVALLLDGLDTEQRGSLLNGLVALHRVLDATELRTLHAGAVAMERVS